MATTPWRGSWRTCGYRSEGEEEAAKIRAQTDMEKTIILAKAYETAQKQRGEGDADSTSIYARVYGKDAEFYAFQRRLQTYEHSLESKSNVVLSTGKPLPRSLRARPDAGPGVPRLRSSLSTRRSPGSSGPWEG